MGEGRVYLAYCGDAAQKKKDNYYCCVPKGGTEKHQSLLTKKDT